MSRKIGIYEPRLASAYFSSYYFQRTNVDDVCIDTIKLLKKNFWTFMNTLKEEGEILPPENGKTATKSRKDAEPP